MKIKEYFKEKPRLRRAIKIIIKTLVIFFAALGVVFSGILIGSCANQKARQVVATTPIQHTKPIQDVIDYNGYNYLTSISDIFNNYTLQSFIRANPSFFTDSIAVGSTYIFGNINEPASSVYGDWNNVDYDTCTISGGFGFNALFFQVASKTIIEAGKTDIGYVAYFYNTHTSTRSSNYVGFNYIYVYTNSGSFVTMWSYGYVDKPIGIRGVDNPTLVELIAFNDSSYSDGYQAGYQSGATSGYRNGYTDGYNEGLEESGGLSNNPFRLISNAFESIASIMDIDVLPHLKLGVLIFTPLIVSIVIVVIKLIRG